MLYLPTSYPDRFSGTAAENSQAVHRPYLDMLIFLLLPTIWNIPNIQQLSLPRILVFLIISAFLFKNIVVYSAMSVSWAKKVDKAFGQIFTIRNSCLLPLISLLLLFLVSELRGVYLGTSGVFSFFGSFLWSLAILFYVASTVVLNGKPEQRRLLIVAFVSGLGLYIALNIIGYAAGLSGALIVSDAGPNKILSVLGIGINRIAFPFAAGLNNFGVMAGLSAASGAMLFLFGRQVGIRSIGLMVALVGFAGAVLVDSRAAVGMAFVATVFVPVVLLSRRATKFLRLLPVLVLLAPFAIIGISTLIEGTAIADLVTRPGDFAQRLGVLSGRDAVWSAAIDVLKSPHPIHAIGYGALGQYTSGASQDYAWVFLQMSQLSFQSLHNAYLQIIFDIGYIGLGVWLLLWLRLMKVFTEAVQYDRHPETVIPLTAATFILLGGILEICGTPAFPDSFGVVLFLVALTFQMRSAGEEHRSSGRVRLA